MSAHLFQNIIYSQRLIVNLDGTLYDTLSQMYINIGIIHHAISQQLVDNTFQIAHTSISAFSDKLDDILRYLQTIAATFRL